MDYQAVFADRFQVRPEELPARGPLTDPRPARRLRDAIEPLAMHAIWSRRTNERLAAFGLSFFEAYVWGRAAALGDPPAGLVVATFGVFEPGRLTTTYEAARQKVRRDDMLTVRTAATSENLRDTLGDADLTGAVATLRRGLDAAGDAARPLFAALRSLEWPNEPAGQLWRACDLLREFRGDSHLAACISAGLDPVEMNILTELWTGQPLGPYTATRGWDDAAIASAAERLRARGLLAGDALSEAGYQFREAIEERTDAQVHPIVTAIEPEFDVLVAQLDAWSTACIVARAFPPSAFKRAAG